MLLAVAFTYANFSTLVSLVQTWTARPDYSHGFIVPFASLYFIYALRDKLKVVKIAPDILWGSASTLAAVLMLMLGVTGGMVTMQQFSILVVIPGLVILLLGRAMFTALLLPLGYLVLMVPLLLDIVFAPLHWPFQLFGAKIAAMLLSSIGIPVFHSAQYIELPNMPLEVANACSGIRYLVSITALAVPLAYLSLDTWPRRVFLVVSSLLIGILANPVRIAIIGLWVYHGGSILHGPGHMLQGYFVSVVGFGFLFIAAWVMSRKQVTSNCCIGKEFDKVPEEDENDGVIGNWQAGGSIQPVTADFRKNLKSIPGKVWAGAISLVFAAGIFVNTYSPVPVLLKEIAERMPRAVDGWTGSIVEGTGGAIVKLPDPDVEIRIAYSRQSGDVIHLQAAYYEYQKQEKEFVHYSMQKLYDGAEPVHIETSSGQSIVARQVLVREGKQARLVTYWYEVGGYTTSSNIAVKLITALRGLVLWKTNGSIVLLWNDLTSTDNAVTAAARHREIAAAIYPCLKEDLSSR